MSKPTLSQRKAIQHLDGPLCVIAGPGTGKTHVISQRVEYLVKERNVNPESILVITFTKIAAEELMYRYRQAFTKPEKRPRISTFHSFCNWMLRIDGALLRLPSRHQVASEFMKSKFIGDAIKATYPDLKKQYAIEQIEFLQYHLGMNPLLAENAPAMIKEIYKKYTEILQSKGYIDFEMILIKIYDLLYEYPEIREKYRNIFEYIMIDEFQDTNTLEYRILELIINDKENILVVGDQNQTIYSFRRVDANNMTNFLEKYEDSNNTSNSVKVVLETNFRSTQSIIDSSSNLIRKNSNYIGRLLNSTRGPGKHVDVSLFFDDCEESANIIHLINHYCKVENIPLNEIAILFRSRRISSNIIPALKRENIPYNNFSDKKSRRYQNAVNLSVLHGVKGKEYDVVFIIGLEEGSLPSYLNSDTDQGIEEERRIFYVGITRAKRFLHISSVSQRENQPRWRKYPSRFLSEI